MRIKITRDSPNMRDKAPSLFAVLSCMLFSSWWQGKPAPHLAAFAGELPRLLYFRAKGCTVCDLIDMRVAQACTTAGVALTVIDRHPKDDGDGAGRTAQQEGTGNILDADGTINGAYGVAVYPCFVLIGVDGHIALKEVGANSKPEVFNEHLLKRFNHYL